MLHYACLREVQLSPVVLLSTAFQLVHLRAMGARASHCFLKNNSIEGEPLSNEVQEAKAEVEEKNKQAAEVAKKKEEAAQQAKAAVQAKPGAVKKKKATEKVTAAKKEEEALEPDPEARVTPRIGSNVLPPLPPTNTIPTPTSEAASTIGKVRLRLEDHVEENNLLKEKRVDPVDGKSYTFEEIFNHYKSQFNAPEIQSYWEKECKPMKANASKPPNQRNNQNRKNKKN